MTDNMFDSLIHTLKADRLDGLLPEMRRSLESLGEEEPLNTCNQFKNFISEVLKLNASDKTNEGSETFPTRTKRTLAEADPSEEPSSNKKVCGESRLQGRRLSGAVQNSEQWLWERTVGGTNTTDCLNALVPKNRGQDISITILVGHEDGLKLIQDLEAIRV
ncbi:hypothetical protein KXV77_009019 [Aspergillus fumigatus]|nr:hypothetical protein KXV77_009019 [Aspergillus fumigatus]